MKRGKYAELDRENTKSGEAKEVTVDFVKLTEQKPTLIGQLLSVSVTKSTKNDGTYLQYLIDTDEGLRKSTFGAAFDREMAPVLRIGGIYRFDYQGQKDLTNGHRINVYKTKAISEAEAKETLAESLRHE